MVNPDRRTAGGRVGVRVADDFLENPDHFLNLHHASIPVGGQFFYTEPIGGFSGETFSIPTLPHNEILSMDSTAGRRCL
jgi:hypothetical protein